MLEKLVKHLEAAIGSSETILIGQLQFINLEAMKLRYANRWNEVSDRVFKTSQDFISKRLPENCLLLRAGDGFMVFPEQGDSEDLDRDIARIKRELTEFYLGDEYFRRLEVRSAATHMDAKALLSGVAPALKAAATAEQAALEGSNASGESAAPKREFAPFYEPGWVAATRSTALSLAAARDVDAPHIEDKVPTTPREVLDADVAVMLRAARELHECKDIGLIALGVQYRTLERSFARSEYLACLKKLDDAVRSRLLLSVLGTPRTPPESALLEISSVASSMSARTAFEVHISLSMLGRLESITSDIVIVRAAPTLTRMSEPTSLYPIAFQKLTARGKQIWARNCHTAEMGMHALSLGANMLSGEIIGPWRPTPEPVKQLKI